MNMTPADRVSAARIRMLQRAPFYGLLTMRLEIKADSNCTDLWVDGLTLGYNPDWVNKASFDALMSSIAHGAHHLALLHHLRREERDYDAWQKACDVPVNAALKAGGFDLPAGVKVSPGDDKKSAEEAYGEQRDKPRQKQQQQEQQDKEGKDKQPGGGEVKDQPGKSGGAMDEAELQETRAAAMQDIAAAAQQAKSSGFGLPGDIERQIKELLYPKADWRELLREFLHSLAKSDYSWSRPNRRFIGSGLYLPSLHSESELGEIVIAVDTSGSIDTRKLALFGGALNELLEELNPEKVTVIYCSSSISAVQEFGRDDYPIEFKTTGGGGTSLKPPFEYVENNGITPDVMLYFTDLGGPAPDIEPDYPVAWVNQDGDDINAERYMRMFGIKFGRLINITC